LRVCISCECARSRAGFMVVFSLKSCNSPCYRRRRVNHRVVGQAPGNGRSSQRPLPRANTFAFNTNRRGFKTRSNGQDEHAGLALLDGDGPASQARRPTVSASVQTRNRTKRRTELSDQTHNMSDPPDEQGPWPVAGYKGVGSYRTVPSQPGVNKGPARRETREVDSEGDSF
jgi:hypothetical protein